MIYKFVVTVNIVVIEATYKYYVLYKVNCDAFKTYERMKNIIVACVRKL